MFQKLICLWFSDLLFDLASCECFSRGISRKVREACARLSGLHAAWRDVWCSFITSILADLLTHI